MQERHFSELGTAQISSILANQQRQKNSDKVYNILDFCFFQDRREAGNIPESYYGSAALTAVAKGLMPAWALFCFKELREAADSGYTPTYPILIAEDCVLLHPVRTQDGWIGLMIAKESAGDAVRVFRDVHGAECTLRIPSVGTKIVAEEGVTLKLTALPATSP